MRFIDRRANRVAVEALSALWIAIPSDLVTLVPVATAATVRWSQMAARSWNGRRFAQSLHHQRGGLERNVEDLRQVIWADKPGPAFSQIDCLKPLVQRDVAAMKQRPVRDAEGFSAAVAFVGAKPCGRAVQLSNTACSAKRTDRAIRPQDSFEILVCAQLIGEARMRGVAGIFLRVH